MKNLSCKTGSCQCFLSVVPATQKQQSWFPSNPLINLRFDCKPKKKTCEYIDIEKVADVKGKSSKGVP